MSLFIDTNEVIAVLLADGWHEGIDGSFDLDAYEYVQSDGPEDDDPRTLLDGGREPLLPATGFRFVDERGRRVSGPLTSILAVQTRKRKAGR